MPLPNANTAWPPKPHDQVLTACQERQVWWQGDPMLLADYYGSGAAGRSPSGTVTARTKRAWKAFWGQQEPSQSQPKRLHVPVAADIGRIAASTLFSEPVTFTDPAENAKLGERIDYVLNTEDNYSRLLVAAESASMLSGSYGRTVWDKNVADHAFIDFVDADRAIPTFKWGRLVEVSFWTELAGGDDRTVYRHVQHYSPGKIDHALYIGTADSLGRVTDLAAHPDTAGLAPNLVEGTTIVTGSEKLAAGYFPNHRPNPGWRGVPELAPLGRSDLTADVIHLLDAMDRVWSSWMNDLELGRGRVFASQNLLTSNGVGRGATFNTETSIYSPIGNPSKDGEMVSLLEAHQFEIRVEEHARTFDALLRRAISRAGYSPITFGLSDEAAATATEVDAKERDTNTTASARKRLWHALGDLATVTMEIDAHQFGTGAKPSEPLDVEWPAHQQSELQRATTVEMLNRAQAASIETKVAMMHPDWDSTAQLEEVNRIKDEVAGSMPATILGPEESNFGPQPADDQAPTTDAPVDDPAANLN